MTDVQTLPRSLERHGGRLLAIVLLRGATEAGSDQASSGNTPPPSYASICMLVAKCALSRATSGHVDGCVTLGI